MSKTKKAKYYVDDVIKFEGIRYRVAELDDKDNAYVLEALKEDDDCQSVLCLPFSQKGFRIVSTKQKIKTSTGRYEKGDIFTYEDARYVVLGKQDAWFGEGDYYDCLNIRTGNKKRFPFSTKGMQKKQPSQYDEECASFHLGREEFAKPEPTEDLSNLIEFPSRQNIREMNEATKIGLDIETFGWNEPKEGLVSRKGEIRLVQVYLPEFNKVIIWDFGCIGDRKELKNAFGIKELKRKLVSGKCLVYIHNASFESDWFAEKFNCPINAVVDSYILSQVYWAGLIDGFAAQGIERPNSLREVVWRLFRKDIDKTNQRYDYGLPLCADQYNYAALDAIWCLKAGNKLWELCCQEGMEKVVQAECSAIPAFAMMNYYGIPVDKELLEDLLRERQEAADKVISDWMEMFPDSNPGSPDDVLKCLAKGFNIYPASTENQALTPYALENKVIADLLLWRSVLKDCQYIKKYLAAIINVRGYDVVRPNYRQNAPKVTGRGKSSNPGVQNIPKLSGKKKALGLRPIKKAFGCAPGRVSIIVDLSASHAQIARQVSGDPVLMLSRETCIKLHYYTEQGLLKRKEIYLEPEEIAAIKNDESHPMHEMICTYYDTSKTVFYGSLNIQGGATLQKSFRKADIDELLETCKEYIQANREQYKVLYEYQKYLIDCANKESRTFDYQHFDGTWYSPGTHKGRYGTARSLDGGRQFVEKKPSNYSSYDSCSGTEIVSYMWMRTEGTIVKNILGIIVQFLRMRKYNARLYQVTHDEIGIFADESQAVEIAELLIRVVKEEFQKFVPDYLPDSEKPEKHIGLSWGHIK